MKIKIPFRNIKLGEWCRIQFKFGTHVGYRINKCNHNFYSPQNEIERRWYPKCISNKMMVDRITDEEKAQLL